MPYFILVAFGMFAWTYHLVRGPLKEGPQMVAYLVTGMVYASAGPVSLIALRLQDPPNGGHWVMVVLYLSFLNDTFAYFTGRAIGKRKLYPEVSPNKTWEGFFGGIGATLGLFVLPPRGGHPHLALAGGRRARWATRVHAQARLRGGLGKIIPGHGGILDRIDALIFNAPITFLYVFFLRPLLVGG
jgi:phosphatidate cytidylyltransferase